MNTKQLDPMTMSNWQGVETFITEGSPVVGRTVGEIEQKFILYCDHIHNCPVRENTRRIPKTDLKLEAGMTVHVWGEWDALHAFLDALESVPA